MNADLERLQYTQVSAKFKVAGSCLSPEHPSKRKRRLQACFKEALRMFPPGHISVREAVEDLVLGAVRVPKGTWIHVRKSAGQTL